MTNSVRAAAMRARLAILGVFLLTGCAWSPPPYANDPLIRRGARIGDPTRTLPPPPEPPRPPDPPVNSDG